MGWGRNKVAFVALALVVAACSGDGGGATTTTSGSPATTSTPTTTTTTTTLPPNPYPDAAYWTDFETQVGAEWSESQIETTPVGDRQFLGQFVNETVELTLDGLEPHDEVTIAFDLYVIGPWDGRGSPDTWTLEVDGRQFIKTSFATDGVQSFPHDRPFGDFPAYSGALETRTLGYEFDENDADAVYRIERTIAHDASRLVLSFGAVGLAEGRGETWGLDNVVIHTGDSTGEQRGEAEFFVEVGRNDATLRGKVESEDTLERISQAAALAMPTRALDIQIEVDPTARFELWMSKLPEIIDLVQHARDLTVTIGAEGSTATGAVVSEQYVVDIAEMLEAATGSSASVDIASEVSIEVIEQFADKFVFFEVGSSVIDSEGRAVIAEVAELLRDNPELRIRPTGFADATGGDDENRELSRERAFAVVGALERLGFEKQARPDWQGEDAQIGDDATVEGRAFNRRVSFVVPPQ